MSDTIRLETATEVHLDALMVLLNDVYRLEVGTSGVGFKYEGQERYNSTDQLLELIKNGNMTVALDKDTSEVVGCVYYPLFYDDSGIKRLYFGPLGSKRKGVGKYLIQLAEEKAVKEGCKSIDIRVVNVRSDVLPMYKKNGYVIYGEAPFPEPEVCTREVHFILMRKEL